MSVLLVIPARGGSKGIPRKNLTDVHGKPLIFFAIKNALEAKSVARVIVSTEDEEIASVAQKYGAEVPFMRPSELAVDEISLIPVFKHASNVMNEFGFKHDIVASLQPTSPLLLASSIDIAINLMKESNCDSVGSISLIEHSHPYAAQKLQEDGQVAPLFPEAEHYLQRQDRPDFYTYTGGLYLRKTGLLENWSGRDWCMGDSRRGVIVDSYSAMNIDSALDLEVLKAILNKNDFEKYREDTNI